MSDGELTVHPGALRVATVFQPVCDLHTRGVVGYEALSRHLVDGGEESPERLLARARAQGSLIEVDRQLQRAALRRALRSPVRIDRPLLSVNCEPENFAAGPLPPDLNGLIWDAVSWYELAIEITERDVGPWLGSLPGIAARARAIDVLVGVDDIGADDHSLGLLGALRPDIIKLDAYLLTDQGRPKAQAILAEVAATGLGGARIVAEGIETEEHRRRAIDLGAHLGQGWLFGRPASLPS